VAVSEPEVGILHGTGLLLYPPIGGYVAEMAIGIVDPVAQ